MELLEAGLFPVKPTVPVAPYLGGKRNLARRITTRLGTIPHRTYVEPFAGMGGIFLRRPFRSPCEVLNDLSQDVSNLFRILQRHYVPLMDMLRWQLTGRVEFDRLRAAAPATLTDLERAARFLYLQRTAFGGKVTGRSFGVQTRQPGRFDVTKLGPLLEEVHERLAGVVIECLPYAEILRRYDRPDTLFYLDPPYWGCESDYGAELFSRTDFEQLAAAPRLLQGTFLLSLNDTPGVREVFDGFTIEPIDTTYSISGTAQRAGEVLISP